MVPILLSSGILQSTLRALAALIASGNVFATTTKYPESASITSNLGSTTSTNPLNSLHPLSSKEITLHPFLNGGVTTVAYSIPGRLESRAKLAFPFTLEKLSNAFSGLPINLYSLKSFNFIEFNSSLSNFLSIVV